MILGIDFGASTTDAVLFHRGRIVKKASAERTLGSATSLNAFLKKNNFHQFKISRIAITGGKSARFRGKILGKRAVHVDEIRAIGKGAAFLSGSRRCLAVSLGTGTCIVLFEKGRARHVIGTGLGGGTIMGLGKLLIGEKKPVDLARLARKGKLRNVDLSVREIVGGSIGLLQGSATASNFAKGKGSRADLAAGVQNMVAEAAAVLAIAASRQCGCRKIVFTGRTLSFPLVKRRLRAAAKCFSASFSFPKNAGFATALGAVLSLQ